MPKVQAALAVASASILPRCSTALSLLPKQRQLSEAPLGSGLFGKMLSNRCTQQWMLPNSQSCKKLNSRFEVSKDEEVLFFTDEPEQKDENSWPVGPPADIPPTDTSTVEKLSSEAFEAFALLLDPTIAKNVPSETIQGAAINGACFTFLASFMIFGPISISLMTTVMAAASVGIVTAYVSITEGTAGDFTRAVGRVTMKVVNMVLREVEGLRGDTEVNRVANALLREPKTTAPLIKNKKPAKMKPAAKEAAKFAAIKVAEEVARAKEKEEAWMRTEGDAWDKVVAEEAVRVKAEEKARSKVEEEARLKAEGEAKLRTVAEKEARVEVRIRKMDGSQFPKLAKEEDWRRLEKQAEAAREAVRILEEQELLLDEEDDDDELNEAKLDDGDREISGSVDKELQGMSPDIRGDVMDGIGDEVLCMEIDKISAVRKFEEEMVMKQNQKYVARSSWNDEMVDASPAAAAVEEEKLINGSEEATAEESTVDYSKMTVTQLKDLLRSKGLKVSGRKAELIERLELS